MPNKIKAPGWKKKSREPFLENTSKIRRDYFWNLSAFPNPRDSGSPSENCFMEPKYFSFRGWLDTQIILSQGDWIPREILLRKTGSTYPKEFLLYNCHENTAIESVFNPACKWAWGPSWLGTVRCDKAMFMAWHAKRYITWVLQLVWFKQIYRNSSISIGFYPSTGVLIASFSKWAVRLIS